MKIKMIQLIYVSIWLYNIFVFLIIKVINFLLLLFIEYVDVEIPGNGPFKLLVEQSLIEGESTKKVKKIKSKKNNRV